MLNGSLAARVGALVTALALAGCGGMGEGPAAAAGPARADAGSPLDADRLMATVRTLSAASMEGRAAGTTGNMRARAWIVERFSAIGLTPIGEAYLKPFSYLPRGAGASVNGANVVGRCAGTGADERALVVSAHYDHLGIRSGEVYPGADDNASGVAVLLAIAETCASEAFRHPVIFVAFDAEEGGLRGARAFVEQPPVPRDQMALDVNLDMVGRGDRGELYASGTFQSPDLKPVLEKVAARAPIGLRFGHDRPEDGDQDWTYQSDHGPFHDAGIPFVYFGVEDHPDYHRPTDTADRIAPGFFHGAAVTILDAVRALDASLSRP